MEKNKCTMYDISAGEFNVCVREVYAKITKINKIFRQLDQKYL